MRCHASTQLAFVSYKLWKENAGNLTARAQRVVQSHRARRKFPLATEEAAEASLARISMNSQEKPLHLG